MSICEAGVSKTSKDGQVIDFVAGGHHVRVFGIRGINELGAVHEAIEQIASGTRPLEHLSTAKVAWQEVLRS